MFVLNDDAAEKARSDLQRGAVWKKLMPHEMEIGHLDRRVRHIGL